MLQDEVIVDDCRLSEVRGFRHCSEDHNWVPFIITVGVQILQGVLLLCVGLLVLLMLLTCCAFSDDDLLKSVLTHNDIIQTARILRVSLHKL